MLVAGRADNIKVTTADDLALAAAILSCVRRRRSSDAYRFWF